MKRGEIWWAELGTPRGSEPGHRRPVVIVQADAFNASKIGTVLIAAITSNVSRAEAPGNVRLAKGTAGIPKSSVVNVAHLVTLNKDELVTRIGQLSTEKMRDVDAGLKLALDLG